ncbi:MAG: PAS domain S-box protein, partial [candidate division NC10 bacterium]
MGSEAGARLAQLELKESELWRAAIGLLILLAVGFAVLSWDTLRHLSFRLEALLIGVVLLIVLFAVFVRQKSKQVAELRGLVRGLERPGGKPVSSASRLARNLTRLRESEALFTELFETLREGVYFTTPDGKLLDANPSLVRMLGYESKEELLGVNVHSLFLDPSQRSAELLALERSGAIEDCEIVLRRKDGSQIICLDSSTAIRDSSGEIVRYQGTLVDITQRREMEKRLHQEQEFARRLVESFPDLIVVLDAEGRYTYVSPRIKEALGFEPQELIGRKVGERTNPDDRPAMLEMFNDLLKGTRTFGTVEYRPQHKQGGWRVFRATASPLYDTGGQIAGVIASSRDVTNLKRMEQQLIQSEKLAAMGQMIAGVA